MKYGVQLYSLRETAEREGAEKILQMVSEAGYDGVEFAGFYGRTPEEMKELLKKYKLVGISAHIRPEAVEENLPYIDALGIKYVFIPWAGAEEFESAEKYAKFLSETKKAKALLDARGVGFGYHNHAHEFENGKDYLKKITDDVAGLKAELDVFWATVAGLDAVGKMKELEGKLAFVHIKEAAKENAREAAQPVVGEGAVGMPAVFAEAKRQGIEWAVLEVEKFPCGEQEYLSRSFENMKKLGN
ncbi:MAG: sugar phosphate isomerase/epimerase family protein [Christensenellaceae bacterium]|jgi:lin2265 protein|nr:sugar phosphate isomerase/epimerase [Clostridia bacterium]PWL98758.1 MAG: hypothetical protein DBY05_09685 [Clostridiales bacterium]